MTSLPPRRGRLRVTIDTAKVMALSLERLRSSPPAMFERRNPGGIKSSVPHGDVSNGRAGHPHDYTASQAD